MPSTANSSTAAPERGLVPGGFCPAPRGSRRPSRPHKNPVIEDHALRPELLWLPPRGMRHEEWAPFPWNEDERPAEVRAWKRGRTGIPFVDAGMREMWVTGRMHNRARMVVASYLSEHLMCHWKIGMRWFGECLIRLGSGLKRPGLAMGGGAGTGRDALFSGVQPGHPSRPVRPRPRLCRPLHRGRPRQSASPRRELFRRHPAALADVDPRSLSRAGDRAPRGPRPRARGIREPWFLPSTERRITRQNVWQNTANPRTLPESLLHSRRFVTVP